MQGLSSSSASFGSALVGQGPTLKRIDGKGKLSTGTKLGVLGWGGVAGGRKGAQGQCSRGQKWSCVGVRVRRADQYGFLLLAGDSYRAVSSSENP
ncbi:hypothetical protein HMPREF2822_08140 [Corynebacterium sp. HMSC062E11]|nr:hypothetical protein HMPREF2822_08140 [Corynebacterium sp. HMSC062E11]OFP73659.1 hypothetical protein HMPREF2974_06620 [Corynebacterium sp. HMSC078C09]